MATVYHHLIAASSKIVQIISNALPSYYILIQQSTFVMYSDGRLRSWISSHKIKSVYPISVYRNSQHIDNFVL